MAMPSSAIDRWDLSMSYTEISVLANRLKFIGLKVFPSVKVEKNEANFRRVKIASLMTKVEDTAREPGGTYSRDFFEWDSDSYHTQEHGVEEVVDDAAIEMYGDEINAEQIKFLRAVNRLLTAYENTAASKLFDSAYWTGAAYTTAIGTSFSNRTTADPISVIEAAIEKVEDNCGTTPNTLVITDKGFRAMKRTSRIEELIKYSGVDDPKNASPALVAEILGLEQILVAKGGLKNTADRGQTASLSRMWDPTMAMVMYLSENPNVSLEDPEVSVGRTVQFSKQVSDSPGSEGEGLGIITEEYREEDRRGGVLRSRTNYEIKRLHKEGAHLLTNVVDS